MENLKTRWKSFFSVILDPWTLVLIIGVIFLFTYTLGITDKTITSLLFVLITIASAVLGGRITKHWMDITEGGIVVARGKSAVRSLKLLLRNIFALERRVSNFSANLDEIENHPVVIKRNYEEVIEICNLLEEEAVNSIENWTDITPEADIKTQIGVISELKQSLVGKEKDLTSLNSKLKDTKGKSEVERKRLQSEVDEKEKQIANLRREIFDKNLGLGGLVTMGGGMGRLTTEIPGLLSTSRDLSSSLSDITDVTGGTNIYTEAIASPKHKKPE
ncbi:MAG: hypothetical protein AB2731_11970 [Candidatus Thiodiazotropha sp.]